VRERVFFFVRGERTKSEGKRKGRRRGKPLVPREERSTFVSVSPKGKQSRIF